MRAMHASAAASTWIFSAAAIRCRQPTMSSTGIGLRSKRWQREMIVGSTFCTSVVAKTNFTCGGGSSRVLSKALNAAATACALRR